MCLYPILIKNPKYKENKKNGGVIPPLTDNRVTTIPIGCGVCIECLRKKGNEWKVRLKEEYNNQELKAHFVTLTFNEESLIELEKLAIEKMKKLDREKYSLENEVATVAIRRFTENWRSKFKKTIRHWVCTELGHKNTERLHMHGIMWTNESEEEIQNKWLYGNIYFGKYVNEKTINYIIKYITKTDKDHKGYIPKILCSKGIGKEYLTPRNMEKHKYDKENTNKKYKNRNGTEVELPKYYKNKLYTDEQKEELWKYEMDKKEYWVCGEMIKIKDRTDKRGLKVYRDLIEHYRKLNKELGFGDRSKEFNKQRFEINRRKFVQTYRATLDGNI